MGKIFKFPKTENQYKGNTTRGNFLYLDAFPSQVGTLTYNGEEQTPTWQDLDPFKLMITGEISATIAGTHYITVTPQGNFVWPDKSQTPRQVPYVINRQKITTKPSVTGTLTFNNSAQSPTWKNYDPKAMTLGGVTSQTNGGTYEATFTPDDNHCWADGTNTAYTVKWTINALKLTKPAAATTSFEYTGKDITISVSNYNSTYMTRTGTVTATNRNSYSVTYKLINTNNTIWSDGTTANVTINWTITKAKVTIPYITGDLTYNTKAQAAPLSSTDKITTSGDTEKTDCGTYQVTLSLADGDNYTWSDGTTADKTLQWKILQLEVAQPTAPPLIYDNLLHGNEVVNYDTKWSYNNEMPQWIQNAGEYTTRFYLYDTVNTKWKGSTATYIDLKFKVLPKPLTPPTPTTLTYDGYEQESVWTYPDKGWEYYIIMTGEIKATNSGTHYVTVSLRNTKNFTWSDGTIADKKLSWYMNAYTIKNIRLMDNSKNIVYDEQIHEPEWTCDDAFAEDGLKATGETKATDAGIYHIKFEPKNNNYIFSGGNEFYLQWSIQPAPINEPTFESGKVVRQLYIDTDPRNVDITKYLINYENYAFTSQIKTGEASQGYYQYIELTPTKNYKWDTGGERDTRIYFLWQRKK